MDFLNPNFDRVVNMTRGLETDHSPQFTLDFGETKITYRLGINTERFDLFMVVEVDGYSKRIFFINPENKDNLIRIWIRLESQWLTFNQKKREAVDGKDLTKYFG